MKTILFLKKIPAAAVAALFIMSVCNLPAFAQRAASSGRGTLAVYQEQKSKSVKDFVVIKEKEEQQEQPSAAKEDKGNQQAIFGAAAETAASVTFLFIAKEVERITPFVPEINKDDNAQYNNVVSELARQSGLSSETVDKALSQLDEKQLNAAVDLLAKMFKEGGSIITCGLYSLSAALNIPEGEAAFLALVTDIKIGAFNENCLDGAGNYGVSGEAQLEVLRAFGYENTGIYNMPFSNFLQSLQNGEKAIVYLGLNIDGKDAGGHVVTVGKEVYGGGRVQYAVYDNGKKYVYTESEFISIMRGEKSFKGGENGDKNVRYNAVKAGGKIDFLPAVNRVLVAPQTSTIIAKENADIQMLLKNIIDIIKK